MSQLKNSNWQSMKRNVLGERKKLYCPKCKIIYETGQRFCSTDNARLIPTKSDLQESFFEIQNIFTEKQKYVNSFAQLKSAGKLPEQETEERAMISQQITLVWKQGKAVIETEPSELFIDFSQAKQKQEGNKASAGKLVNPFSIPSGTVEPGDRSVKPLGREAFNPEKPRLMLGKTLKGRYEILNFIKQTPKFCVYAANDLVAEKNGLEKRTLVYIFTQKDDNAIRNTLREERVSFSHTKHPNIAIMIDSGRLPEGNPFMVLEFPEGEPLDKKISEKGYIDIYRVARIIYQAAEALGEAHRNNVLHRNLTPQKVILAVNDKGIEQVKVMEFAVSEGEVTEENFMYLAPEQLQGKSVSSTSDIFSLGVIAYQLLTKRLPFEASTIETLQKLHKQGLKLKPSQLRIDISSVVDEVLQKALAFEPSQRYLRARDFGDAFYNALVKPLEETLVAPKSKTEKNMKDKDSTIKNKNDVVTKQHLAFTSKQRTKESEKSLRNLWLLVLLAFAIIAILYFVFANLRYFL